MGPKRKYLHGNRNRERRAGLNKRSNVEREARPRLARHEYTVGWICAIVTEYVAGQAFLDEEHECPHNLSSHDAGHYTLGKIGRHNVVMAVLPEYGTSAATAVARDMMRSFPNVSIGLMVGIGGGAPTENNDIRLGDVVVGTARNGQSSVVQYDFGKTIQGRSFQQTSTLNQPPWRLSTAANGLRARHRRKGHQIEEAINDVLGKNPNLRNDYARPGPDSDNLYRSNVVHPADSEGPCAALCGYAPSKLVERSTRATDKIVIHYGVVASANQVMKDALTRDKLANEHNFLCFEMEAAGISNNLPSLVIRGICDYSDSHKNKRWQGYAAMTAAAYAKEFLNELVPLRSSSSASTLNQLWNADLAIESIDEVIDEIDMEDLIDQRRQELLDSLTFKQIDARQMTIKRAHAETCKWVLTSPQYLEWLDRAKRNIHNGFLWIKGKPGTGKSTLMKVVSINYRKEMQHSTPIIFYFNARGEQLEKSTVGMYRSLLCQLIEGFPQLRTILDFPALVRTTNGPREWTLESLKDLFEEVVLNLENLSVTCFIDALDECDEDEIRNMVSFFEYIAEATTRKNVNFKFCFSSRHYPHITISKSVSLVLEGQKGHQNDIVKYVSSELKIGNSKTAQQVRHELQEKASGVFMWVVLVVDILNKENDRGYIHRLRQRLREIPSDLNTLFRDILVRDHHHRDELRLCIQWVLFAKEPLSPEQLYFAILSGIEVDLTEALADWNAEDITADDMWRFILDSSKGLAEITRSKNPTVQFIHESVRDWLLKDDGLHRIWSEFGNNFNGQCHEKLKRCCINYLNFCTSMEIGETLPLPYVPSWHVEMQRLSIEKTCPFLRYAAKQVLYHSDAAEKAGVGQLDFLQSFDLAGWITLDNILEKEAPRRHTPKASLLYILAKQNRANLISIERSRLACFKVEEERYGAPILAALAIGSHNATHAFLTAHKESNPNSLALQTFQLSSHQERIILHETALNFKFDPRQGILWNTFELGNEMITSLLLELGEPVADAADPRSRAPMSYAAERGHLAVCQFLLKTDLSDIDQKDANGLTPLCYASRNGHDAVVKLLIESGRVDTEQRDKNGQTALSHASENGHDAVVKLLLDSSAIEVDSRCDKHRTPLSYAVSSSQTSSVVKLLLDNTGTDLNSKDILGRTPFSYAVVFSSDNTKLLIETGKVDIDEGDDSGRTPLSYAAARGFKGSIKLLLDTGTVDVDSKDKTGRTPLSYAAARDYTNGYLENVKLLLATGKVEVGSQDSLGRTPLSYASQSGTIEVVSLLLDTGQADPTLKDESGRTSSSYAMARDTHQDRDDFVQLLQPHSSSR